MPLGDLDIKIVENLESKMTTVDIFEGDVLFNVGDSPDYLYFLQEGEMEVQLNPYEGRITVDDDFDTETLIKAGSIIGEDGFFNGEKRTSRVVAKCKGAVHLLSRKVFYEVVVPYQLEQLPLLSSSYKKVVLELLLKSKMKVVMYNEGDTIIKQGSVPMRVLLIASGNVLEDPITVGQGNGERQESKKIKLLQTGMFCGLLDVNAFVTAKSTRHSKKYTATNNVVLFEIDISSYNGSHLHQAMSKNQRSQQ